MKTISFAGIEGQVLESSPHGSFLVVKLSDRITIVGTFNNQFDWEEAPDISSGFRSFITYIGVRSPVETTKYINFANENNGYFYKNETSSRRSKRIKNFPLELKVRGLTPQIVAHLVLANV